MGAPLEEVNLLAGGIKAASPTKGSFALNMFHRHGAWQVRKGFGQLAQYDTSMSTNPPGAAVEWGYTRHVGSYLMETDFGHTQIISVLEATNMAANVSVLGETTVGQQGNWEVPIYCVSIHDVTTGERWEEPIYRHTSEGDRTVAPLYRRHGQEMTTRDLSAQAWIAHGESAVWFAEFDDRLLFGSPDLGVLLYSPCAFRGNRRKTIDLTRDTEWASGHCESAAIIRVAPSRGVFYGDGEGFAYFSESTMSSPVAATALGDRMVYASGRDVYFSDPFYPTSILILNKIDVPSEMEITALSSIGEDLFIFTGNQVWGFRPPPTTIVTQGRGAQLIMDGVGCIGANAVTRLGSAVAWCDKTGVFLSTGGGGGQRISDDIAPFFSDFITDPVTSWYPNQGAVGADAPTQRNLTLSLKPELVSMAHSEALDALFISVPDENIALCYADSQWSVWSFESNTYQGAGLDEGAVDNIQNPWLLARGDDVFVIGGIDSNAFVDESSEFRAAGGGTYVPIGDDTTSRSYYILEYGRGGAIDRSVDNEDYRTIAGKYRVTVTEESLGLNATYYPKDFSGGWVTVDPWIKVAEGYRFTGGTVANNRTYLLPVSIVPPAFFGAMPGAAYPTVNGLVVVLIYLKFDNAHWTPVFSDAANSLIEKILPSERMASSTGYDQNSAVSELRAKTIGGVVDSTGSVIHMLWDGASATGAWYHKPDMALNALRKNVLLYLPMMGKSDAAELSGMALAPRHQPIVAGTNLTHLSAALWDQWVISTHNKDDSVAQPVDWAYKSDEVGADTADRLIARGIAAKVLSHGVANDVVNTHPYRLFNTLVAADQKMNMAQPVDHAGEYTWAAADPKRRPLSVQTNVYPTSRETVIDTLRARLIDSSNKLRNVIFDNPTAGVGVWGAINSTDVNKGDVLVADEQVDTVVTSDGLKCSSFSYLMFGFMQNRAESLKIEMTKGLYRLRPPGRRRRGR